MTFRVLTVCTGNICRSPMAERLMLSRLPAGAPVQVASAGTGALVGHPMDGPSAVALELHGGDPTGHEGRRLTAALIDDADLVLCASAEHRARVVAELPLAFRRAFTLREFARLGAGLAPPESCDVEALRARVVEVAEQRGLIDPVQAYADDVPDPYRRPDEVVREVAGVVSAAVDGVLVALGLVVGDRPVPTGRPVGRR